MNFIRRDSYDRQNVMTIRLISIMIITDIKINSMIRAASRIELISIEIIHLREIRDTIDKVKRRIEDVLIIIYIYIYIFDLSNLFFLDENDDSYWKMRDDDQIEELKIISRRIFVEASLRSLLKYIHEMRRSSSRVSSIDEYLSINFQSITFESKKEKESEVR